MRIVLICTLIILEYITALHREHTMNFWNATDQNGSKFSLYYSNKDLKSYAYDPVLEVRCAQPPLSACFLMHASLKIFHFWKDRIILPFKGVSSRDGFSWLILHTHVLVHICAQEMCNFCLFKCRE